MTDPLAQQHLSRLFEIVARTCPEQVAVSAPDGELTYRRLDVRADLVAARLRLAGVGREVVVPLLADASTDLIVGLLGILKAGGAYQPIDPDTPERRIRWLINDSGSPVVLATTRTAHLADRVVLIDGVHLAPDPPPAQPRAATDLAYVIHTSGSTGDPKGVLVEHRNVVRLFEQTRPWFHFADTDVWMMFHSVAFDFSVWEIWGALLHGGRLGHPFPARRP